MWDVSKDFTIMLFDNASKFLAELIYTAWLNAGSPTMTTDIIDEIKKNFSYNLEQNYPNPFNPETTINFHIPNDEYVSLTLHDINGETAAVLINGKLSAGNHTVKFDAGKLSAGVYFYKLDAGSFSETKKMMLVK
jgi:hypothetical protein